MEEVKKIACMEKARPFISVIMLQVGLAGMDILTKAVLNKGMSNYVLVVYRHAVATVVMAPFAFYFDKKVRPKMTLMIFFKITILGLLEPVIDQNLYYLGMKYTTATFATAMYNVMPAITFLLAYIVRLERVKMWCIRSVGKVVGTLATVAGAMIMTLFKGPVLDLFWTRGSSVQNTAGTDIHSAIKGSVLVTIGCFGYACFMILQAITLNTYPAELSLTAWICLMGTIEGTAVALVMEKGNPGAWAIGWDTKLLTATYSGIVCSGLAYYIGGVVMKDRGPVFVTAFSPLCMIIVAILSTIIFAEQMYLYCRKYIDEQVNVNMISNPAKSRFPYQTPGNLQNSILVHMPVPCFSNQTDQQVQGTTLNCFTSPGLNSIQNETFRRISPYQTSGYLQNSIHTLQLSVLQVMTENNIKQNLKTLNISQETGVLTDMNTDISSDFEFGKKRFGPSRRSIFFSWTS